MVWDSDKIKSLRLRLGWSSADLARRLSCESVIVTSWEQGVVAPNENQEEELNLLLKQADSSADEVSSQVLAEIFLEETNEGQCDLHKAKARFVEN
jgi:ribosome-binding protein aMBF1 (putative translation factor)